MWKMIYWRGAKKSLQSIGIPSKTPGNGVRETIAKTLIIGGKVIVVTVKVAAGVAGAMFIGLHGGIDVLPVHFDADHISQLLSPERIKQSFDQFNKDISSFHD